MVVTRPFLPRVRPGMSRSNRNRQLAIRKLTLSSVRNGSIFARKTLTGIRSQATRNLEKLRKGLMARAVLRRAMRRRAWRNFNKRNRAGADYVYGPNRNYKVNLRRPPRWSQRR